MFDVALCFLVPGTKNLARDAANLFGSKEDKTCGVLGLLIDRLVLVSIVSLRSWSCINH